MKLELPDPVPTLVKNVTEELSLSAGKTFNDIWFLVFGCISHAADKRRAKYSHCLANFEQELSESISKIPKDKQMEPSLQITAQALENSKYCVEKQELRQMFTSLISHSMNKDFASKIHPSFAEIIKQMSVMDAKIIQLFKENEKPVIGLPVCQYRLKFSESSPYASIPEHIFLELPDTDLMICSQSLSSLSRLGVVSVSYEQKLDTPNLYDKFLQHPIYRTVKEQSPFEIMMKAGAVILTPLGRSFVEVCLPD